MSHQVKFVGRRYEVECIVNLYRTIGIPSRELVFICGPSGIGKSRLVKEAVMRLSSLNKHALNISLARSYSEVDMVLRDLANQIDSYIEKRKSDRGLIDALKKVFSDIEFSTKLTPFIDIVIRRGEAELTLSPMEIFYNAFEKMTELFREYGGALVFIDELQNFLRLQEWDPWGIFKFFTTLQEYTSNGLVKFILISSDYLFRKRIVERVPGEYITTFYLGDLDRDSALELLDTCVQSFITETSTRDHIAKFYEYVIEFIGGHPALIIQFVQQLAKHHDPRRSLYTLITHILDDVYNKYQLITRDKELRSNRERYRLFRDLLDEITYKPLKAISVDPDILGYIDRLVSYNILQYANSQYLSIYEWSMFSGGEGGLDVIAPSSRPYLYALCELTGSDTENCRGIRETLKHVGVAIS